MIKSVMPTSYPDPEAVPTPPERGSPGSGHRRTRKAVESLPLSRGRGGSPARLLPLYRSALPCAFRARPRDFSVPGRIAGPPDPSHRCRSGTGLPPRFHGGSSGLPEGGPFPGKDSELGSGFPLFFGLRLWLGKEVSGILPGPLFGTWDTTPTLGVVKIKNRNGFACGAVDFQSVPERSGNPVR